MTRPHLALVKTVEAISTPVSFPQMLADHQTILQGYLDTHTTRNHSDRTIESERRLLIGWFESFVMQDDSHPDGRRHLLVWEAMEPVQGRQRIVAFSKGLIDTGLKPRTVQSYLGSLRRLFQYFLEYPYIPGLQGQSIVSKYGRIEQPVLEYDYPVHTLDQEEEGFVLVGEQLFAFYDFVRLEHIAHNQKKLPVSRDYIMIVVAAESGLRADEIRHLDALGPHRDLFYERNCIQTRHGKGTRGSGKRVRKTIFTPFAQDTVRIYEERIRPHFPNAKTNPALFLTESGERITYKAMWHNLHVIVEEARKAGLELPPKLSSHSLRKSFATAFMELHPDRPWVLMDLMGHLNPSTLHRYVLHSRVYYDQAIEDMVETMVAKTNKIRGVM